MIYKETPLKSKTYFQNRFSQRKKKLRFFLDIYIDVEFSPLSIYEVFRAIPALSQDAARFL